MTSRVNWKLDGDVAVITVDSPPLNLMDAQLLTEFEAAVTEALSGDARAVLLRAEGKIFSGGADVHMFRHVSARQAAVTFGAGIEAIHRLELAPVPTIAAVHGLCLTGGLELALGCDVIVAAEGTKLGQTEASIGTTTLLGGAQRIAQRAGTSRARLICYGAAIYDAADFERWGIVDLVLPADGFQDKATELAREYAAGPTRAHAAVKGMIRTAAASGVRAADDFLLAHGFELFETADMQHGVEALLTHGGREYRNRTRFVGH